MTKMFLSGLALSLLVACASDDAGPSATGGPVAGPGDAHCGDQAQSTSAYACNAGVAGVSVTLGTRPDHVPDAGLGAYGATMTGTQGSDDACKYDVGWTSTPIRRDTDVTFTLTVRARVGGTMATGAAPRAEVYLDDTHPAPNTSQSARETAPGTYSVGPVRFDRPGRWTVRFHVYESCVELTADSPHGHAAFYVDVP